jgi:hypothetical protein
MALCTLLSLVTGACLLGSIAAQTGSGENSNSTQEECLERPLTHVVHSINYNINLTVQSSRGNAALLSAIDTEVQKKCL